MNPDMSAVAERGLLRWKEWMPLVTQQQRLRSLIQVIAYNIKVKQDILNKEKPKRLSYYYTLHLSTMSAPLYTSEKLESENPKWSEIEIDTQYGAVNGVVIRLWACINGTADYEVTVWGVFFSGLVYLGPKVLNSDPSMMGPNSLVFHMVGGYFTASHCFINPQPLTSRMLTIQMNSNHVKPSYAVNSLLRLHELQQAIKKQTLATLLLREQISSGCAESDDDSLKKSRGSAVLRKLLSKPVAPRAHPQKILAIRKEIELKKFRIQMLVEEKEREEALVHKLAANKEVLKEKNQDRDSELMNSYYTLRKNIEKRKQLKQQLIETKDNLSHKSALLDKRKKTLMSQLSLIYPIIKSPNGSYTIREVFLPDSEDFDGKDELMISVALGFVTHLVQMMSFFLNVPTRYPMVHFGSRSKIIDHIKEIVPDIDREFPLYSRGKEKHLFDYGVFLLNRNIAQLRWYCGIATVDLRPTLSNLLSLMDLNSTKPNEKIDEWSMASGEEKLTSLSPSTEQCSESVLDVSDAPATDFEDDNQSRYNTDFTDLVSCKSTDSMNSSQIFKEQSEDLLDKSL